MIAPHDFAAPYRTVRPLPLDHLRVIEGYDHTAEVRGRIEAQERRERRERVATWFCLSVALFASAVFAWQFFGRGL